MWLNNSQDQGAGGETRVVDWNGGGSVWMNQVTDTGAYPVVQGDLNAYRYFRIFCDITPDSGYINQEYSVIIEVDGQEFQRVDGLVGNQRVTTDLNPNSQGNSTYIVRWIISTDARFDYNASIIQTRRDGFNRTLERDTTTASSQSNESTFVIGEEIPNLKIIDFLKGLFNMFKLVIIPMDDGVYYVDTVTSFYETGSTYDITKYIDFSKYNVERGVILNEIDLKFKDPETLLASEFKKNNNRGYGDLKEILKDNDGELLDGDSLTFELPFEQFVYEKLNDIFNDTLTSVQYGAIIDPDLQPTNPAAHIFYNRNILIRTTPIAFIESSGNKIPLISLNTPFHHYNVSEPNYATVFTPEFSTFTGVAITNNLYTRHYRDYINTIFNVKKRTFNYEAYLPIRIITKLNLNDTLFIKGNYYRIDKYNYNLLTGKTVLNLINNFQDEINPTSTQDRNIYVDYKEQTETITVTNSNSLSPNIIDQGSGTNWVSLSYSGDNVNIDIDENNSLNRSVLIRWTTLNSSTSVYLFQSGKDITTDNNTITVDNNIITVDND